MGQKFTHEESTVKRDISTHHSSRNSGTSTWIHWYIKFISFFTLSSSSYYSLTLDRQDIPSISNPTRLVFIQKWDSYCRTQNEERGHKLWRSSTRQSWSYILIFHINSCLMTISKYIATAGPTWKRLQTQGSEFLFTTSMTNLPIYKYLISPVKGRWGQYIHLKKLLEVESSL